jgi:DNA polymerase III subunit epsilon
VFHLGVSVQRDLPLADATFVAFDTETTGYHATGHCLVEIAGVKFAADGTVLDTFESLVDPRTHISYFAQRVHGISETILRGQPLADAVLARFCAFLGGPATVLVAHNAPFDLGVLRAEFGLCGLPLLANPVLCTLALSRACLTGIANHQLATVAAHLEVPAPARRHRALDDSLLAMGIVTRLLATQPADRWPRAMRSRMDRPPGPRPSTPHPGRWRRGWAPRPDYRGAPSGLR